MDAGAGFWIFLAAVIVGGGWVSSLKEAERQQTLRRLLDKGDALSEQQLRELLESFKPRPSPWDVATANPAPSDVGKGFRVAGGIMASIGVAIFVAFSIIYMTRFDGRFVGFAIGTGIVVLGAGVYLCSRFWKPERADAAGTDDPRR